MPQPRTSGPPFTQLPASSAVPPPAFMHWTFVVLLSLLFATILTAGVFAYLIRLRDRGVLLHHVAALSLSTGLDLDWLLEFFGVNPVTGAPTDPTRANTYQQNPLPKDLADVIDARRHSRLRSVDSSRESGRNANAAVEEKLRLEEERKARSTFFGGGILPRLTSATQDSTATNSKGRSRAGSATSTNSSERTKKNAGKNCQNLQNRSRGLEVSKSYALVAAEEAWNVVEEVYAAVTSIDLSKAAPDVQELPGQFPDYDPWISTDQPYYARQRLISQREFGSWLSRPANVPRLRTTSFYGTHAASPSRTSRRATTSATSPAASSATTLVAPSPRRTNKRTSPVDEATGDDEPLLFRVVCPPRYFVRDDPDFPELADLPGPVAAVLDAADAVWDVCAVTVAHALGWVAVAPAVAARRAVTKAAGVAALLAATPPTPVSATAGTAGKNDVAHRR
ncbi:hypothetical protein HK405_012660 [Cladochytrium tenue]|nr:hypothetical protein HK405_012660 [Cladochytrium tenue]